MNNNNIPFTKINYIIMIVGLAVLVLGFVLMASGGEYDLENKTAMTYGPITVFIGFSIEFAAILYRPKQTDERN